MMVRDFYDEEWILQYFKGIDATHPTYKYVAWSDGATSKTAEGYTVNWAFCELVEVENGNSSI